MAYMYICPLCFSEYNIGPTKCGCCGATTVSLGIEKTDWFAMSRQERDSVKQRFQKETNEHYDRRLRFFAPDETRDPPPDKPTITCPYCQSTNVEKITMTKKVVKGWFWGAAAASTLVKEWHCKNCKSNF